MNRPTKIIGQDISAKSAAAAILAQAGMSYPEMAEAFNIQPKSAYVRLKSLPKDLDVTSKKRVKLALKSHDLLVQGLPVGEATTVRAADVNTAISRVLDRHQPIKRSDEQGSHVSYTQVNINVFACE